MGPAESCDGDAAFNSNRNQRSSLVDSSSDFPSADCEHKETAPGAAADQSSPTSTIGIGRLAALVDLTRVALFVAARLIAVCAASGISAKWPISQSADRPPLSRFRPLALAAPAVAD
jgi:hypothetical protein